MRWDAKTGHAFLEIPMTGNAAHPIAAADSAADLTLELLFDPEPDNRLVQNHAEDAAEPSLRQAIESTLRDWS